MSWSVFLVVLFVSGLTDETADAAPVRTGQIRVYPVVIDSRGDKLSVVFSLFDPADHVAYFRPSGGILYGDRNRPAQFSDFTIPWNPGLELNTRREVRPGQSSEARYTINFAGPASDLRNTMLVKDGGVSFRYTDTRGDEPAGPKMTTAVVPFAFDTIMTFNDKIGWARSNDSTAYAAGAAREFDKIPSLKPGFETQEAYLDHAERPGRI